MQLCKNEKWKIIRNFQDYEISNLGNIRSLKNNKEKILNQNINGRGYVCINLSQNGKIKTKYIHILIYENLHNCKLKNNECIHHIDENRLNNNLNNLEKMIKSNHHKLHANIENRKGENNNNSILITQDVLQIKLLLKIDKLTQNEIANIFGISQTTVSKIKRNIIWSNINIGEIK